jgi:tetratricopeptide (TPR) repeat protein
MNPQISLCMIVKNEEENLPACLLSVKDWVDEMVIVDTGSADKTKIIAEKSGARVFDFAWTGDLGAARNFSLDQAKNEWILILDADEQIDIQDAPKLREITKFEYIFGLRVIVRSYLWDSRYFLSTPNPKNYSLGKEYSYCLDVPIIRIFKNNPVIRYRDRVHELVEPVFHERKLAFRDDSLVVHHFGKVLEKNRLEEKKWVYLELGRQKLLESPESAAAHYEYGVQLFELEKYYESVSYFEKAFHLNNRLHQSLHYLALSYQKLGQIKKAQEQFAVLLQVEPEARTYFEYGNFLGDQGDFESAFNYYKKCLKKTPKHSLAVFNLGRIILRMGKKEEGISQVKLALQLDPDNETLHEEWGRTCLTHGTASLAIASLEDFMLRFPNSANCPLILSRLYQKEGNLEKALEWAVRKLNADPANFPALTIKAQILLQMNNWIEAEKACRNILDWDPAHLESLINLASIFEQQDDIPNATLYYQRALAHYADDPRVLKRASCFMARKQNDPSASVLELMERACQSNPVDGECHMLLGQLYERNQSDEKALEIYRKVIATIPKYQRLAENKIKHMEA